MTTFASITIRLIILAPFYSRWDDGAYYGYLRSFGLPQKKKLKKFSRGMKTKFSLAVALSHGAELVIMDEPTSGLDPVFRRGILDILLELIQDERKSVLFSTHITSDLDRVADYITFINEGQIVFSAPRDDILENYGLVRGGKELLDQTTRPLFVGIRETSFGFEALTGNIQKTRALLKERPPQHRMIAIEYHCPVCKTSHQGRFFKKPDQEDFLKYEKASEAWKSILPKFAPDDEIPAGDKTDRLHRWGYRRYREMFNNRQLLGLELSCRAIAGYSDV